MVVLSLAKAVDFTQKPHTRATQCVRDVLVLLCQCLVSHYTDTHFYILSLISIYSYNKQHDFTYYA
jgi:hypothetical protein